MPDSNAGTDSNHRLLVTRGTHCRNKHWFYGFTLVATSIRHSATRYLSPVACWTAFRRNPLLPWRVGQEKSIVGRTKNARTNTQRRNRQTSLHQTSCARRPSPRHSAQPKRDLRTHPHPPKGRASCPFPVARPTAPMRALNAKGPEADLRPSAAANCTARNGGELASSLRPPRGLSAGE